MPKLKKRLLKSFYKSSATTELAFADRCGVARNTLQNASNGLNVTNKVLEAIACGMGFLPQEMALLCQDNNKYTPDQLVDLSLQRLGLGLWGVCDHNFVRTERFLALLQHWRGEQIQRLRGESGEIRELVSTIEGQLRVTGRTVGGNFTIRANEPGFFVEEATLRVEGYWFGDKHYIAIYRHADSSMPNYGTVRLRLSLCKSRLSGNFTGWGDPISKWVAGKVRLRRVTTNADV